MTLYHFTDGSEPGPAGLLSLAARALELKGGAKPEKFPGKRIVGVFMNPSLRTRTSLEVAAHDLGIHPITLSPGGEAWKLEHRPGVVMNGDCPEHLADAVPVLAEFADMLAVRSFAGLQDAETDRQDPVLAAFHRYSPVPVINLESALWHPLQGLADAATWVAHFGESLRGLPVTLTWAPHPKALPAAVPNQVALTAALAGAQLTIAHPEGFDLDPQILSRCSQVAEQTGGSVRVVNEQMEGVRGARVVIAKSWAGFSGYGRREEEATQRAALGSWTLTERQMKMTENAGFMHCLPVRRNVVVADEVIDGPRSWTTETGGLRRWTAMALLERLFAAQGENPWSV